MKFLLFLIGIFIGINCCAQAIRKDTRPESVKEDYMNTYQASQISKIDLLSALDAMGVRLFSFPMSPGFTKTYKLEVRLTEYVNGKPVSIKSISPDENNLYYYYIKKKQYADYINKIKFIARDVDTACLLTVNVMGNTIGGIKLKKHLGRPNQYYLWRSYKSTHWKRGVEIPLLAYSSSWYDKKDDVERSCGPDDLSNDKVATTKLLNNSPHYFIVSYKISK
jgi:hypothetical protein